MNAVSLALAVASTTAAGSLAGGARKPVAVESLEWMAASAGQVVAGKVVRVEAVTIDGRAEYEAVTVAVAKTLKGTHTDRLTVLLWAGHDSIAQAWMDAEDSLLFCLAPNEHAGMAPKCDWSVRRFGYGRYSAIRLGGPATDRTMPACTREFSILTATDTILKRAEDAISAAPKGRKSKSKGVEVPDESAVYERFYAGSAVTLVVPDE